jgi:hypothetical protein
LAGKHSGAPGASGVEGEELATRADSLRDGLGSTRTPG